MFIVDMRYTDTAIFVMLELIKNKSEVSLVSCYILNNRGGYLIYKFT